MAEDEINVKGLFPSSPKTGLGGSLLQPSNATLAEDKTAAVSTVSAIPAPGVSTFHVRQHIISPSGLQLANSAVEVVLPVQGLTSQTGLSHRTNVQLPKSGIPLIGATAASGQITYQTQSAFQQAIPGTQSMPVSTTAVVGQQITLQKGQQVTVQRSQAVTLQRFPNKDKLSTTTSAKAAMGQEVVLQRGQQVTVQRSRPVSLQYQSKGIPPICIQQRGLASNYGRGAQKIVYSTEASNNNQVSSKLPTAIQTNQNNQPNLRLPCSLNQQVTLQKFINPVVPQQQNSAVLSSHQIISNAVSQATMVLQNSESPTIGTATILSGQQIAIQPRPAGSLSVGPASTPITLTVTSISPAVSPAVSSFSSAPVPVIAHTSSTTQMPQKEYSLLQRPTGMVVSQPSVIRAAGIPVVLPRSALTLGGRQQVLQGALQRLIHRPLVSPAGNCGGQVTVQIPHIVGPIIKMPNFKQPAATPTTLALTSKELSFQKVPSSISTDVGVTTAVVAPETSITQALTQATPASSTYAVSISVPSATPVVTSNISSQSSVLLSTVSDTDPSGNGCVSTASLNGQLNKESPVMSLNTDKNEHREEDTNIKNASHASLISPEKTVLPTPVQSNEVIEQPVGSCASEVSNISVLPNTLATLRNYKNNLVVSPTKDSSPKDENKQSPGTILTEGFIDSNLLDWDDNIGTLPGTDMKFKVNEFGDLELLDEGVSDVAPNVKTDGVDDDGKDKEDGRMQQDDNEDVDDDDNDDYDDGDDASIDGDKDASAAVNDPAELMEREDDPICCCVYCGRYGYKSTFRASGRFCSRTCAGKKNMHRKEMLMSRMLQGSKNKKKTTSVVGAADSVSSEESTESDKTPIFDWEKYLGETGAVGAPKRLFKEPFPTMRNGFKLGMRLEGVDPKHQALICVLSVAEIKGFRLRLHFDGYSECYDFWVNADSPFIFPVGWAEKNGKSLQPPKNIPVKEFSWTSYLNLTGAVAAPKHLFSNQPSSVTPSAFRVGMKLEARDQRNPDYHCAATVADTLGDRVLLHFDCKDDFYDSWCEINSPNIRPIGWCRQNRKKFSAPHDYGDAENFTWDNYLADTKSTAVPARAFKPRAPVGFEIGMKLEVTDKRNPILVRVATVKRVKNIRLLIKFDGWDDDYDYWIDDDSSDLHPPQWCTKTFHDLEPPIDKVALENEDNSGGCPTKGCKGIGHIKGAKYSGHHSDFGCPYSMTNMSKDSWLADRLGSSRSEEGGVVLIRHDYHGDIRRCPTPGCNGLGHVTGKFTSHHCVSGCPLAEKNILKAKEASVESRPVGRPVRGRKRKMFGFNSYGPPEKHFKTEPMDGEEDSNQYLSSIHESVFQSMSGYLPVRVQPLGWSDHTKLLPGVFSVDTAMVDKWSIDQVADFIQTLTGKEEQAQRFRDEEIDGDSFLLLQQSDLVNFLNIKLGPAVKIFNSIQVFKAGMENL